MRTLGHNISGLFHKQAALPGLQPDHDLHSSFRNDALRLFISVSESVVIYKAVLRRQLQSPLKGELRGFVHQHYGLAAFSIVVDGDERCCRREPELSRADLFKLSGKRIEPDGRNPDKSVCVFRVPALITEYACRFAVHK